MEINQKVHELLQTYTFRGAVETEEEMVNRINKIVKDEKEGLKRNPQNTYDDKINIRPFEYDKPEIKLDNPHKFVIMNRIKIEKSFFKSKSTWKIIQYFDSEEVANEKIKELKEKNPNGHYQVFDLIDHSNLHKHMNKDWNEATFVFEKNRFFKTLN